MVFLGRRAGACYIAAMLHRPAPEGVIIISQPAHGWVSGQLARAWGNEAFGAFAPAEEVCLAAEQHDLGFIEWEQSPSFNPQTGRPHSFMDLPTALHLELWAKGIRQMLSFGRYPALLVSLHYASLRKHRAVYNSPEAAPKEREFLETQARLQAELLTSLKSDPYYAPFCAGEILERNRQLLAVWDWLSLLLCLGFDEERRVPKTPAASEAIDLVLRPDDRSPARIRMSPWPFRDREVKLAAEGRHLRQTSASESQMRAALRAAPPVPVIMNLLPG